MIKEISIKEFRNSGLLWFTNQILHIFGMAIVVEYEGKEPVRLYPARVKFRGFDEKSNDRGYRNVTKYMIDKSSELIKECED